MVDFTPILERLPSILPREEDSVIKRYLDGYSDESNDFGEELEDIRNSRFVDKAVGGDLDEIGKQYGAIGKRAGRDDESYRAYLKSLVQVFRFRGTVPGIKSAVAAGLDINPGLEETPGQDDIEIFEHFNDEPASSDPEKFLEYSIELYDWTPHEVGTVTELAGLSDASVSRLRKIEYKPAFEEVQSDDTAGISEGFSLSDGSSTDDDRFIDNNLFSEDEQSAVDDALIVDANRSAVVEGSAAADTISEVAATNKNAHFWDGGQDTDVTSWGLFEWTEIVDVSVTSPTDTAASGDTFTINKNKLAVSDSSSANDAINTILSPDGFVAEGAGLGDSVTGVSFASITWNDNDWESFNWASEHN